MMAIGRQEERLDCESKGLRFKVENCQRGLLDQMSGTYLRGSLTLLKSIQFGLAASEIVGAPAGYRNQQ